MGANDYASMKEVVNRRYARMLEEAPDDLPQLVVIDGGKGQLDFAYQAICELGLQDRMTVIGLAKRLEEVIRVGDPYPLFLDRNSQALKLLQRIRDEGPPLRNHIPPFAPQQGGDTFGAAGHKGCGRTDRAQAADALRKRGPYRCGVCRRPFRPGRALACREDS